VAQSTRRAFLAGLAGAAGVARLGPALVFARSQQTAKYHFIQFHNQAEASSLHQRLVQMWSAIRTETGGRVDAQVFAENRHVAGSDPAALAMLVRGEIQFFTLMGGILGNLVPAAEVQQVPFAFPSASTAQRAMDGPLGRYVARELASKGVFALPVSVFDNGLRQVATRTKPIVRPDDLAGMKIRIPDGRMFHDVFSALGAEPVTINVDGIYGALKSGAVEAQENPLAVVELFKIYEVVKYVSMTNHMWSGFNLIAHLPTWNRLPADLQKVIARNAARYVRRQRNDQAGLNGALRQRLAARGLVFNDPVAAAPFRARLSGVYAAWKERLGRECWSLLEAETGRLS
jgi:tripartite ATP-independent transporter DctP family solute receptor